MNKVCSVCGSAFIAPLNGKKFCSRPCAIKGRNCWPAHRARVVKHRDPMERFLAKITERPNGCRIWTGATIRGYGEMRLYGQKNPAYTHRWIYEQLIGPIPDKLTIDHLCRTPLCQNTDHMELVTIGENVRRGNSLSSQRRRMTHCKKGHPFDAENTRIRIYKDHIHRQCRICNRDRRRVA